MTLRKWIAVLGIMLGLASSILGIVIYGMYDGSYEWSETYGGDAYTGIQNAAAQTANNVEALANIVNTGFGSVLLIGGLGIMLSSVEKLLKQEETVSTADETKPCEVSEVSVVTGNTVKCPSCGKEQMKEAGTCAMCDMPLDGSGVVRNSSPQIPNKKDTGKCELCGKEDTTVVNAKITDDLGVRYRKVCSECFVKNNCQPAD